MLNTNQNMYRYRLDLGKTTALVDVPPLLDVQLDSFTKFLQSDVKAENRKNIGLESALRESFPIVDNSGNYRMEYKSYSLGESKYDQIECRARGITYSVPLRVTVSLVCFDREAEGQNKKIKEVKEQEIYFGDFPLMTERGSFIINGTERVIVSQLHRSPGVFFKYAPSKTLKNLNIFSAQIIPHRGTWINFEIDHKDLLQVSFDKKQKMLATVLLKALNYTTDDILKRFYVSETIYLNPAKNKAAKTRNFQKAVDAKSMVNQRSSADILAPTGEIIVTKGAKINKNHFKKFQDLKLDKVSIDEDQVLGRVLIETIHDKDGKVIVKGNEVLSEEVLENLLQKNIDKIKLIFFGNRTIDSTLRDTLAIDGVETYEDALKELFNKVRPSELFLVDVAKNQVYNMFFNADRYDLSVVGRMKLNRKLGLTENAGSRVLSYDDILEVIAYLLNLKENIGEIDDIDHLSNRRVKTAGELIEIRFRTGLARMEKIIKEKMSLQSEEKVDINDIINPKPLVAVINEFFGSSQLSQFMDQTNPLSEITHKRRLSALGPGGVEREHAGLEVRDVHNSHYGRICPVETPEGANIGLILSFTCFAKINEHGFIETPYRIVKDGKVTDEIAYLSAIDEDTAKIVQPQKYNQKTHELREEYVSAKVNNEFSTIHKNEVEYMDVAPNQTVSVAASLIPFLEHDDANRALMGSNMQRQAVPVIKPEAPLVGTGIEFQVAKDSGTCIIARNDGVVDSVDASRIVLDVESKSDNDDYEGGLNVDIYHLEKYNRSNQNTCINNRPLVKLGDKVKKGQIIADGACTESGELALGQNVRVAFMPWNGYNYEDSILVSEKVLADDRFTSVHIEELECSARDTKLGKEQITADLPNVSEYLLRNLDASGIIMVGSYVRTGDILVGKVTPKGESTVNPEDRLLRAIFGDKAGDVRDSSLKVPRGIEGVVIDVKMFNRRGVEKDQRAKEKEQANLHNIAEDFKDEIRIIKHQFTKKILPILKGEKLKSDILSTRDKSVLVKKGAAVTSETINNLPEECWKQIAVVDKNKDKKLKNISKAAFEQYQLLNELYQKRVEREQRIDDLPPGVVRTVKVYIAIKRTLSVGDKMAGRHGNKGVISRIIPVEDMPYTEDGAPVDIVLNPLGVPSRMNIGQILECQLGLVAKELGKKIENMLQASSPAKQIKEFVKKIYNSDRFDKYLDELSEEELIEYYKKVTKGVAITTPVFDGAEESDIFRLADLCGLEHHGKLKLYDGLTGDAISQKVTVGYMYMLKLHHLVDEKIHARSIGPYSLVTQQPLGGKAQKGGQRFGEMEVWALEAYGAAYTLREMLTVKSDDVVGRNKVFEAIVKGVNNEFSGMPEAFKVLINELRSLCIDMKLIKDVRALEAYQQQ